MTAHENKKQRAFSSQGGFVIEGFISVTLTFLCFIDVLYSLQWPVGVLLHPSHRRRRTPARAAAMLKLPLVNICDSQEEPMQAEKISSRLMCFLPMQEVFVFS
jgi:hypothetical protein